MFDELKYTLLDVPYSMVSAYFTGWINIFNVEISIIDLFAIWLIIMLYVAYVFKYNSDTSIQKSYKEFITRTVIIFTITLFAFWKWLFSTPAQIIEWNMFTHNAVKEQLSEWSQFTTQDIFNKQYIVEWVGSTKKTKIEWIGSYMENWNNFYIDTKAPVYIKFQLVSDIEKFIADWEDPENLWIKVVSEWWKNKIVNISTPIETLSANGTAIDQANINTTTISDWDNKIIVKNPPQFSGVYDDKFKKTYFGKTTYLNDFWDAPLNSPTKDTTYYVVDDSDTWIMKVMKVYKQWTDINITFYVIPNLYTYQLDKTVSKSINADWNSLKVYQWYKGEIKNSCVSGTTCSFDDIYKQKTKNIEFKVNDFLSAFSLMNGWYNSSITWTEKYKIKINNWEVLSSIWFFDNLAKFDWRVNALSNNFNGMNYVNNQYIISYVNDKNDEVQRNTYWLGIYSDNSFFKNFYITPVWNWEIWFWSTIVGAIFLLLFFVVYIFWSFFIVFVIYQILN